MKLIIMRGFDVQFELSVLSVFINVVCVVDVVLEDVDKVVDFVEEGVQLVIKIVDEIEEIVCIVDVFV